VIYTGAVWGEGRGPQFGSDFQQPFFEDWLRWAGITDIATVRFSPNLATADVDAAREQARGAARTAAAAF
jgi:FMN-dependent NADH-azoreductase